MTLVLKDITYYPEAYNALPSLEWAEQKFNERNALSVIQGELKNLILAFQLEEVVAMQLLHRHFDMSDDEVLVDTNGTSIPWQQADLETPAGIIEPTSWKLTSGVLYPFEYAFKPEGTPSELSLPTSFVEKLYSILSASNLSEVLGLGLVPKDIDLVETTKGRANVTWSSPNHGFLATTPTMWVISPRGGEPEPEPVMACIKICGYQTKNNAQHTGAVRHDKN